jgi:hypothetical protein
VTVIISGSNRQIVVSPESLTFTKSNWGVPQHVTVSAVDDKIDETLSGNVQTHPVAHFVQSGSAKYSTGHPRISPPIVANNSALSLPGGTAYHFVKKEQFYNWPDRQMTLSFWIKTGEITGNSFRYILSYATASHDNELSLSYQKTASISTLTVGVGMTSLASTYSSFDVAAFDGNWHHLALLWRGDTGQASLYLDGAFSSSTTIRANYTIVKGGTLILGQDQDSLGGGFDASQAFQGIVDEMQIWNVLRNASEIARDMRRVIEYDTMADPSAANMVAYWRFDEGSGNTAKDYGRFTTT